MGISHSWNGTVLTITSDSGTSSADLKGDMGIRGPQGIPGEQFIPEKGVDYFTPTEIADIREEVKEDLTPYIDAELEAVSNELTGYVDQKAQGVNSSLTSYVDTEVNEAKEYANANFAPSGYGLGDVSGSLPILDDCHNAMVSGWYNVSSNTANGIEAGGVMRVDAYGWGSRTLTIYSTSYTGCGLVILQKNLFNGSWTDWEWVNPPMIENTEYRTTERWNGKAVYTKLINCDALPASGRYPYYIGYMGEMIRFSGKCGFSVLPYRDVNSNGYIDVGVEQDYIVFNIDIDEQKHALLGTAYVQLWYAKG